MYTPSRKYCPRKNSFSLRNKTMHNTTNKSTVIHVQSHSCLYVFIGLGLQHNKSSQSGCLLQVCFPSSIADTDKPHSFTKLPQHQWLTGWACWYHFCATLKNRPKTGNFRVPADVESSRFNLPPLT